MCVDGSRDKLAQWRKEKQDEVRTMPPAKASRCRDFTPNGSYKTLSIGLGGRRPPRAEKLSYIGNISLRAAARFHRSVCSRPAELPYRFLAERTVGVRMRDARLARIKCVYSSIFEILGLFSPERRVFSRLGLISGATRVSSVAWIWWSFFGRGEWTESLERLRLKCSDWLKNVDEWSSKYWEVAWIIIVI